GGIHENSHHTRCWNGRRTHDYVFHSPFAQDCTVPDGAPTCRLRPQRVSQLLPATGDTAARGGRRFCWGAGEVRLHAATDRGHTVDRGTAASSESFCTAGLGSVCAVHHQ